MSMMAMLAAMLAEPLPIHNYVPPVMKGGSYSGGGFKNRKQEVLSGSVMRNKEMRRKKRRRAQHESRRINYANA